MLNTFGLNHMVLRDTGLNKHKLFMEHTLFIPISCGDLVIRRKMRGGAELVLSTYCSQWIECF